MFCELSKRSVAEIPKEWGGRLCVWRCQFTGSVVPFCVFNDTECIGGNVVNSGGTEKCHALAFCLVSPLRERLQMPINDSELRCCCWYVAEQSQRDRHAVYAATDNGNGDVSVGEMAVSCRLSAVGFKESIHVLKDRLLVADNSSLYRNLIGVRSG